MSNTRSVPLGTVALCACLLPFALLTGCGGGSSSASSSTPTTLLPVTTNADGSISSTPRNSNGLQFTITANKSTYAAGELVGLMLAITNTTTQPVAIAASSYANQNVLFQASQNNKVVWTLPQGGNSGASQMSNTPGVSDLAGPSYSYTIPAGQTLTRTGVWFQTSDATGHQVAPGTYTVDAYLTTANINGVAFTKEQAQANLAANPISITIHN